MLQILISDMIDRFIELNIYASKRNVERANLPVKYLDEMNARAGIN